MKIQLAIENWSDLMKFVPRHQLLALLFQLFDKQFVSILQYSLNKDGHITLGLLRITAPKETSAIFNPILELCKMNGADMLPVLETTLPEEPIPINVHDFESLTLSYYDSTVLEFLRKFHEHQNNLFDNVNLSIRYLPAHILQPILTEIYPIVGDTINSMQIINHDPSFVVGKQFEFNSSIHCNEYNHMMNKIMTQIRILSIRDEWHYLAFQWYCRWLYSPRIDGRPRMLSISLKQEDALDFIKLIKKDFLMAKDPVSFFVRLQTDSDLLLASEDTSLENSETKEKMVVDSILISRYPMAMANTNGAKWIQENEQEILDFEDATPDRYRTIYFDSQLKDIQKG